MTVTTLLYLITFYVEGNFWFLDIYIGKYKYDPTLQYEQGV